MRALCSVLLLTAAITPVFAEPANFSGTWTLNAKRSTWGKKPAPKDVKLVIEHNEPKLKYRGVITDAGDAESTFAFDGAIDGKPYPIEESGAARKLSFKRRADGALLSETLTADGKPEGTSSMTLSKDGRTLVRKLTVKGADERRTWTEIYEKQ